MIGRRVQSLDEVTQPGDYFGPAKGFTGDLEACFFLLPGSDPKDDEGWPMVSPDKPLNGLHHVTFPPHTYRECGDGSLEIRASIGAWGPNPHPDGFIWHGYLDEGHVWREC